MSDAVKDRYAKALAQREQCVEAILQSVSEKKIVVAGPGTGKTFLFKQILKGKSRALTLTFVNSLVEDLSLELCGLSEVRTLHGFARSVMANAVGSVKVYPKLSKIITEDAEILKGQRIDFDPIFYDRDDKNEHLLFYKRRRIYYDHYGFADIIYAAVLYLELKREKIPTFDQVLIDEFQDFNQLEVSLIDLLASKNPILLAGDDDQSLYHFKNAKPSHIRQRYSDQNTEYSSFNLPHCSRCTRAIVGAVNDITAAAKGEGFLKERIDKPYIFFEDQKKEEECERYPKIAHVTCFSAQVPYFITKAIRTIAEERREKFSVLVIAPTNARGRKIGEALEEKGFENVHYPASGKDSEPTLLEALALLAADSESKLGWRIIAKFLLAEDNLKDFIRCTAGAGDEELWDLLDASVRETASPILQAFKRVVQGETPQAEHWRALLDQLRLDPQAVAQETLKARIEAAIPKDSDPAVRNIPIKITTIPSSKGLAEDYVFISDFDDRFLLEKDQRCTDQKIYDVLVALTRARRKVFLLSLERKEPKFLTWIAKERIEKVTL